MGYYTERYFIEDLSTLTPLVVDYEADDEELLAKSIRYANAVQDIEYIARSLREKNPTLFAAGYTAAVNDIYVRIGE